MQHRPSSHSHGPCRASSGHNKQSHKHDICCAESSSSSDCVGAAEQFQGEVRANAADRQDSASQGHQETAQSLQADSAPGSSTGPDGPPSVSKGGRRGGSKTTASAPKRQMNFWQEEEKAQFLTAYRVSTSPFLLDPSCLSYVAYRLSNSPCDSLPSSLLHLVPQAVLCIARHACFTSQAKLQHSSRSGPKHAQKGKHCMFCIPWVHVACSLHSTLTSKCV